MLPRTLLIAACPFDARLSAAVVSAAIADGLGARGWQSELCPIEYEDAEASSERAVAQLREVLGALGFDARMRAARALIIAERRLHEDTLAASVTFELATRARQAGVPAYAVTGEDALDSFDARVLDLQAILQARSRRSLTAAGRKLAGLL